MKRHLLIIFLLFISLAALAQGLSTDELRSQLKQHPQQDTFRVNRLIELGRVAGSVLSIEKQDKVAYEAVYVSKKINETETAQRGRLCFDFRKLNSMIKPLNFLITNQKNFFDQAAKYSIFSSLDVRNAFLSIHLTERAQKAASIITPFGVFNTLRTPFGLKSSPSAFCRAMSFVVGDLPFVSIYMDDLLIGASSPEEMVDHLIMVFERLNKYNLKIQLTKSKIFTNK